MKYLTEKLSACSASDIVWLDQELGKVSAAQLFNACNSLPPAGFAGKRIAVGQLASLELVATLVYLDGLADVLLLLPLEDDAQARSARLAEANIDIVVEGKGLELTKLLQESAVATDAGSDRPGAVATTWLLPTSGTTGSPKLIPHTLHTLTRSMKVRRMADSFVWGSLYSFRRFAGLQVFLQCWMNETALILNDDTSNLAATLTHLSAQGCNAVSATPSMWRKLAMHPLFDMLDLRQITLGGEIVDQAILDILTKRFPSAHVTHIYASTEAGVGFSVRDGKAGFPAEFLAQQPAGIAMRIDEHSHLWFRCPPDNAAAGTMEAIWIDSGDVVAIVGNRIHFLGRANGSINVGGNKVMPEEVENVIKELPDVAFVQVRARKSAILGNLVEAAIKPVDGVAFDAALKKQITNHCRVRLEGFKVPAFIVATDSIQLTASGKLSRVSME